MLILFVIATICLVQREVQSYPGAYNESILPKVLEEQILIAPDETLVAPSQFLNLKPWHAKALAQMGVEDLANLKWIGNGTHYFPMPQYVYRVEVLLAFNQLAIGFRAADSNNPICALNGVMNMGIQDRLGGLGNCWFLNPIDNYANQNQMVNYMGTTDTQAIGLMNLILVSQLQEQLAQCSIQLLNAQTPFSFLGWGQFHR